MQTFQVYKNLAKVNDLTEGDAKQCFLDCCGSSEWARRMTELRPFRMLDDLFNASRSVWFSLSPADHLEAFAAHPNIGAQSSDASKRSADWLRDEQPSVETAGAKSFREMEKATRLYAQKFGFIFIVSAAGKTVEEMLAICRARYGNSIETELQIAAEEQQKITHLRLAKLLEK